MGAARVDGGTLSDQVGGVITLFIGATFGGLGVWAYVGARAEWFFRRQSDIGNVFLGVSATAAQVPFGSAFVLFGVAFLIGKNAVTEDMLVAGLALLGVAVVAMIFHPKAILPRWARSKDSAFKYYRRWWR